MPKVVHFPDDYYDMGSVKYAKGSYQPLTSETQSIVNVGHAELLDSDAGGDHIAALEGLAVIAESRSQEAQQYADQLKAEADQARSLLESARAQLLAQGPSDAVPADANAQLPLQG